MVADEYDFWVLDLDGTLVDVEPSYIHGVFEAVGDRLGIEFSDHQAEAVWHGLSGTQNEYLQEMDLDSERFWETFHEVESPQTRAEHTFLYDDAAFVGELDSPVGVVTHCQRYLTDPVLDHLDIRDWFDTVVCCTDETGWKPDPTPVELAMEDLGVSNATSQASTDGDGVLAGDGPHDIGAAWNAGLDGIHVERHGPERRGHCVLGDYRVESFQDLSRQADVEGVGSD